MKHVALADRYARALVKFVQDIDTLNGVLNELEQFQDLVSQSKELQQVLYNPTFASVRPVAVKKVLEKGGCGQIPVDFLLLLIERHRIEVLPDILESARNLADVLTGTVRAEITSSWEMAEERWGELTEVLKAITGKNVEIERKVDAEIMGGIVTRIGSKVFDSSLRSQLEKIEDELAAR